jgi:ribosome-associated protein
MSPPTSPPTPPNDPPTPAIPPKPSPDDVRVTSRLIIPSHELLWRFTASGGPGGQHANTSNTRAEVVFDVLASDALTDAQKARIEARLGSEVRVVASSERSQLRNRALARARLAERLAAALHVERPRRATKPSKGAVQRRLTAKSQRSGVKRERKVQGHDD